MKDNTEITEVVEMVRMSLLDQLNALLIAPLVKVIMDYAFSLMTVSCLPEHLQPLPRESEQKLLTVLKQDLITALNLTNTGVRLSKALKAVSENKRPGSLVVDGSTIRLYPHQKPEYIPKTESIGKIMWNRPVRRQADSSKDSRHSHYR